MSKPVKYISVLLILCAGVAGIFYYTAHARDEQKAYEPKAKPVKTITVHKSNHIAIRSFPGKVRASKRVDLAFEVSGVLTDLPVRDGLMVKKGQLLARLDQRTFKNNVLSAQAAFTETKLNYERQQKLYNEKIVAQSILDSSKSAYDRALATLEINKKALSDTELLAPFDGIITNKYVENHQKISSAQTIVSLQDMTDIEIVIQVPESIMVYATPETYNSKIKVKFDAIANREFDAKVHEYSIDADSQTQTYEVVLTMPTSAEFNFLPGMTATVTSSDFIRPTEHKLDVIFLPSSAIQGEEDGNKTFVFVISANNTAEKRYIKIDSPTASGIPVISGLNEGEKVIVAGSSYLRDGMPVRSN